MDIKTSLTQAAKVIAFVLAFFILLEGLSLSVFSGRNAAKFNSKLSDAYSFVDEPKGTIQVAGVGDSNLYSGFVPFSLWNECGYTSTVCASPKQSIKQSAELLKKVYQTQRPQLVIIETDMFYDNLPQTDVQASALQNKNNFFDKVKPDIFENDVPQIFSIFTFHNRWKKQQLQNIKDSFLHTHGYRYNDNVCKLKINKYMNQTDETEPMSNKNKYELAKLTDLCSKEGSQILFVTAPTTSAWNYERHNTVQEYADKNNIKYIDMNLEYQNADIDLSNAFRDNGKHLSYSAADKMTRYIGKFIKENYNLTCQTDNPEYAKWTEDLNNFNKQRTGTA